MSRPRSQETVYVAMSGGVDSAVAAALLKKSGVRVVGVFMKPWQTPGVACLWERDREDALRVAAVLDIPLETWDFSREYRTHVAEYMIDAYRAGQTPNPDVLCNKEIKFGLFLKRALAHGATAIATGHYARTRRSNGAVYLAHPSDTNKDQTYFLWSLGQAELSAARFPLADLTKPKVRMLARRFRLPVADKKDSQGVCFVGQMDVKAFLQRSIPTKPGAIRHVDGRILGSHDGAAYYTIGQRHGLDITIGGGPYYVVRKNMRTNTITVGDEADLLAKTARISKIHWAYRAPHLPARVQVQVRYRSPAVRAVLSRGGRLVFSRPVRALAAGQFAVLWQNGRLIGGGTLRS